MKNERIRQIAEQLRAELKANPAEFEEAIVSIGGYEDNPKGAASDFMELLEAMALDG